MYFREQKWIIVSVEFLFFSHHLHYQCFFFNEWYCLVKLLVLNHDSGENCSCRFVENTFPFQMKVLIFVNYSYIILWYDIVYFLRSVKQISGMLMDALEYGAFRIIYSKSLHRVFSLIFNLDTMCGWVISSV